MKRITLSILGCLNCHAKLAFAGQALGNIASNALTHPGFQKASCTSFKEV